MYEGKKSGDTQYIAYGKSNFQISPPLPRLTRPPPSYTDHSPTGLPSGPPQCHRSLLVKLNPAKCPFMWKTPQKNIHKDLPIDEITHRVLPLQESHSFLPLLNPDLVPTLTIHPPDPSPDSYTTMKKEFRSILLRQWSTLAPSPPGYPFAPSLSPHPFMGLSKFLAGLIHQMRSGKGYLAAHPRWFNRDLPSLCPRCWAAPETFEHAVLHCKSRSRQEELHLPRLDSLDADSPVWSSNHLVASLAKFILTTSTCFPPDMFPQSPYDTPLSSPFFSPSPRPRFSSVEDD